MINESHFVLLVTRALTATATAAESAELALWLERHPALKVRYTQLQHYFEDPLPRTAADTELALQHTLARIRAGQEPGPVARQHTTRLHFRKWWAAAASVALLAGAVYYFTITARHHPGSDRWLERANGKATRSFMELADGSRIWLNAESRISYPEKFNGNKREIFLEGEAFFEVAASPVRPFIIHLKNGTIKVLGTSFNIRAYDNEPVQTAVVTGKVAFIPGEGTSSRPADTVLITPDVKVTWSASSGTLTKVNTISTEDKAWTEGRLIFRNATLEEIGASLQRNFNKRVEFEANAPRQYRLTGAFHNNSLEDIMFYLSRSKAFHYRITDSTLVIGE